MSDKFLQGMENIQKVQATIDDLLGLKIITYKNDASKSSKWFIQELYHKDGECNIGFAEAPEIINETFTPPLHKHPNSKEFIICVTGSVILNIGGITRVLKEGECASIPEGVLHYSKPLRSPAKLFYICIPNDTHFTGASEDDTEQQQG